MVRIKALLATWAEMIRGHPVLKEAVLIPFRQSIISDGLVTPYHIYFEKGHLKILRKCTGTQRETTQFSSPIKNKSVAARRARLRDASCYTY